MVDAGEHPGLRRVGEVWGNGRRVGDASLSYFFAMLAVAIVGVIFVVRRTLVLRAAESLAACPDDSLSLNHLRTGYLTTYVLCEALAVFGLILRFRGCSLEQSVPTIWAASCCSSFSGHGCRGAFEEMFCGFSK